MVAPISVEKIDITVFKDVEEYRFSLSGGTSRMFSQVAYYDEHDALLIIGAKNVPDGTNYPSSVTADLNFTYEDTQNAATAKVTIGIYSPAHNKVTKYTVNVIRA